MDDRVDTLRTYSIGELFERVRQIEDQKLARRTWGNWKLTTTSLELLMQRPGSFYAVDLERLNTSAEMLDTIIQVAKKKWATPEVVGCLVKAFQDIFEPQTQICGCGTDHPFNATAYLRHRYGDV